MVKKILQKDAPVLRKISEDVSFGMIKSPKIQSIIQEMKDALASQEDGVAIAAPQIGYSLRIFVVSGKTAGIMKESAKSEENKDVTESKVEDIVFINPIIKKISKEKKLMEEGCLSVRYLYGKVRRSTKASVIAFDEHSKKFERGGTGILAQIFQHEIDHLDGILFTDKAKYLEEILPIEKLPKNLKDANK